MAEERTVTTVNLFTARYNELVAAELKLRALEKGGVHMWDGYESAMTQVPQIEDGPRVVWR